MEESLGRDMIYGEISPNTRPAPLPKQRNIRYALVHRTEGDVPDTVEILAMKLVSYFLEKNGWHVKNVSHAIGVEVHS